LTRIFAGIASYNTDQTENRLRALFPRQCGGWFFPGCADIAVSLPGISRKPGSLLDTLSVEVRGPVLPHNCFFQARSLESTGYWTEMEGEKTRVTTRGE